MMIIGGNSLKFLNTIIVFLLLHKNYGFGDYSNIRCTEGERQALLDFKTSLAVESKWLSSWGDEEGKKECCEWRGVKCSNTTGHVVKLDLKAHNLQGNISHSLMELQHLEYLDLSFNNLHEYESLKWLSYLSNLQYLDLSLVDLYKANDWLKVVYGLSRLSTLKLSKSSLHPPTLTWSLSLINVSNSLVTLDLHGNYMILSTSSILFQWLFKSNTTLVSLDLSSNNIYGLIPNTFGKFMVLRDLDLSDNRLEGMVPKSFGNLCSLQGLNLSRNRLNGSLAFLHNLSSCSHNSMLKSLDLHSNSFSGSLPDLSVFPLLKEIDFQSNILNGTVPRSIRILSELKTLDLSYNNLEGLISELHLSNLSKLRNLDLSSNSFTMKLNPNWVPSFRSEFLNLRSCKLGPNFPNWLATQTNLSYLDISNNEILDTIPTWFGDYTPNMQYINLSRNQIHGRLPNISTKFPSLAVLDMSSNSFEGPLLPFPTNLTTLNLSTNSISGSILALYDTTTSLIMYLDLSNNQLSGLLPDYYVSRWTSLQILNLAHNNSSGEIFNSIGSLGQIKSLSLQNNSFFGELPFSLRDCKNLTFIDLSDNKFSGIVPLWIGESLFSLEILLLQSNEFSGSIPWNLCGLQNLQVLNLAQNNMLLGNMSLCLNGPMKMLNLSGNKLSGNLPDEIPTFSPLIALDLSRNDLSGEIPRNIGNMIFLKSLDLSENQFSGEIPMSLANLTLLKHLNLSVNFLYGRIPLSAIIQSFSADSYTGNPDLYGPPLTQNSTLDDGDEFKKWLYVGMAMGFSIAFWGVSAASLFLNRTWGHAHFFFLFKLEDWLLLRLATTTARLQRRLRTNNNH